MTEQALSVMLLDVSPHSLPLGAMHVVVDVVVCCRLAFHIFALLFSLLPKKYRFVLFLFTISISIFILLISNIFLIFL